MFIRNALLVLAAIALIGTACQPPSQEISPLTEADVAAIKSLGPSIDRTALEGDWDALFALMTEDVLWIVPNSPVIQGRAACKAWVESLGLTITEHKIEFLEIDGYGDIAYARGTYTETITVNGNAEPIEDAGNVLAIVRKQSDGSWLIAIWIGNSDRPLPEQGSEVET